MKKGRIETPSAGEILKQEFLDPLGISAYRLSKDVKVSTSTILDILHDRRKISAEMALRLSRYFGNSYRFWLNLQNEIEIREIEDKKGSELNEIKVLEQIS